MSYQRTASVIFEGTGSYVGTKTATFKISGKIDLKDSSDFTFSYGASVPFVKGGVKYCNTQKKWPLSFDERHKQKENILCLMRQSIHNPK